MFSSGQKVNLAVIFLVIQDGQIVIGKKKEISGKSLAGLWQIPSGTLNEEDFKNGSQDFGGLIEAVTRREAFEELNLAVSCQRVLDSNTIFKLDEKNESLFLVYILCCLENPDDMSKLKAGDDLEEVKWVPVRDVLNELDKEAVYFLSNAIKVFINATTFLTQGRRIVIGKNRIKMKKGCTADPRLENVYSMSDIQEIKRRFKCGDEVKLIASQMDLPLADIKLICLGKNN